MRQHSWIAFVGIFALVGAGCAPAEDTAIAPSPVVSPAADPAAVPTTSPIAQATPGAKPFNAPTVPQQTANVPGVPGLIPSTNSDVRSRNIPKGRQDPFENVPLNPQVTVVPPEPGSVPPPPIPVSPAPGVAPQRSIPVPPPLPQVRNPRIRAGNGGSNGGRAVPGTRYTPPRPPQIRTTPRNQAPRTAPNSAPIARTNTLPPAPPLLPKLPPLPEPTLARNVEVTGVVQVGREPQAIVKVPNEPSRYVGVGQRLSNGQVLVKRIEVNNGGSPIVILEQYGREVARRIGEKPEANPAGAPTAAVPGSPQA